MVASANASRVELFDVFVPAGTAKASPIEVPCKWNPGELAGLEVFIPDGHNGTTGLKIALAHNPIIPQTQGAWIIGNDEKIEWPLVGYPNTGAWSAFAYNLDLFDHTFHVRFLVADFAYTGQTLPTAGAVTPFLS